jgi:hypothetical protein
LGNKRRRLEERREEALERQTERSARTPIQQLEKLDIILGIGAGAKRERARLQLIIEERKLKQNKTKKKSKENRNTQKKNNKKTGKS